MQIRFIIDGLWMVFAITTIRLILPLSFQLLCSTSTDIEQFPFHVNLIFLFSNSTLSLKTLSTLVLILHSTLLRIFLALLNQLKRVMTDIWVTQLLDLLPQLLILCFRCLQLRLQALNLLVFLAKFPAILRYFSLQVVILWLHLSQSFNHFLVKILLIFETP